ncbi:8588_t:CDS:1, partial [Paraglomus brasilianum]
MTVGIFNMCQALISIYKIFRRTPASTDVGQRNGETTTATSNENVQNVDNRNDITISIDTMDET